MDTCGHSFQWNTTIPWGISMILLDWDPLDCHTITGIRSVPPIYGHIRSITLRRTYSLVSIHVPILRCLLDMAMAMWLHKKINLDHNLTSQNNTDTTDIHLSTSPLSIIRVFLWGHEAQLVLFVGHEWFTMFGFPYIPKSHRVELLTPSVSGSSIATPHPTVKSATLYDSQSHLEQSSLVFFAAVSIFRSIIHLYSTTYPSCPYSS